MLFNSYIFLFIFLPITLMGYFCLKNHGRNKLAKSFLVIASLFFYGYFRPAYLLIIISSIIINFLVGRYLGRTQGQISIKRKSLFAVGILFNLGLLGVFKYLDFVIVNTNLLLGTSWPLQHILLPLGISFYTFQQLSYLIDSWNGKVECRDFCDYALFVTFFPQLVAGPIVLPQEMLPQFAGNEPLSPAKAEDGLFLLGCGLVKKCFIADAIAVFANVGFDSTTTLTCGEAWLVSIAYTMQLYFDFSGYCDMAMGIGKFFGIDLPLNFNSPYKARNFQDFWRRWHITLGRFLMNYLYIPLGGNRCGELRTLLNLLVVFVVSGLWHGAGWTFVLWGGLHGICILLHRLWSRKLSMAMHLKIPGVMAWAMTFFMVNLFWVFFRATTLNRACEIVRSMFMFTSRGKLSQEYLTAVGSSGLYASKILFGILIMAVLLAFFSPNSSELMSKTNRKILGIASIVFILLGLLCVGQNSPFLYFNF